MHAQALKAIEITPSFALAHQRVGVLLSTHLNVS